MFRIIRPGFILMLLLAALLFSSCGKNEQQSSDQIPVVAVSFSINPNSTEYIHLNVVGGYEYLTGGYRGILVYRKSVDEFVAFERACPYDWQLAAARVVVDSSGVMAYCPACKSKYLILDGTVQNGPTKYPLKQYQANYDGTLLYVYN